ncbi:MAG: hypothetical protein WAM53_00685 [Terrimicrobiaceae bacterium]
MRLPIEYLVRAREDLTSVLRREPSAPAIVHDACKNALVNVLTAIDNLDSTPHAEENRECKSKLQSLQDTCNLSRIHYREICEWLAGGNESEKASRQVLYMICSDLQISEHSARTEIGKALRHINVAIEQLSSSG